MQYIDTAFPSTFLTRDIDYAIIKWKGIIEAAAALVLEYWWLVFPLTPVLIILNLWWTWFYGAKIQPKWRYRWKLPSPKVTDPKWKKVAHKVLRFILYWWSRRLVRQ